MSSHPPHFNGVRATRSLVLYVCFVDRRLYCWLLYCLFFFDIRILITSFGIFKLFLIRPTWMQWLYKVRLMRNDMNCLFFPNRLSMVLPTESKLLLLCLGFAALAWVFVQFFSVLFCILFHLFLLGGCCAAWPVCLYNYEFWLSLCKIVRSSVILLLPLFVLSFSWLWFWYSFFFSKQLVINSYMPFYHNIIGF
jgi:hypothetical protein